MIQNRVNFITRLTEGERGSHILISWQAWSYGDRDVVSEVWRNSSVFVSRSGNECNNTTGASNQCYLTIGLGFGAERFHFSSGEPWPGKVCMLHYWGGVLRQCFDSIAIDLFRQIKSLREREMERESLFRILRHESISALKFRCLTSEGNHTKFPKVKREKWKHGRGDIAQDYEAAKTELHSSCMN